MPLGKRTTSLHLPCKRTGWNGDEMVGTGTTILNEERAAAYTGEQRPTLGREPVATEPLRQPPAANADGNFQAGER